MKKHWSFNYIINRTEGTRSRLVTRNFEPFGYISHISRYRMMIHPFVYQKLVTCSINTVRAPIINERGKEKWQECAWNRWEMKRVDVVTVRNSRVDKSALAYSQTRDMGQTLALSPPTSEKRTSDERKERFRKLRAEW